MRSRAFVCLPDYLPSGRTTRWKAMSKATNTSKRPMRRVNILKKAGLTPTQAIKRLKQADDSIRDALGEDIEPQLRKILTSQR